MKKEKIALLTASSIFLVAVYRTAENEPVFLPEILLGLALADVQLIPKGSRIHLTLTISFHHLPPNLQTAISILP
jgi:hypothetical protein